MIKVGRCKFMVYFDHEKMGVFLRPPGLEWDLERGYVASKHIPKCISKLLLHFEYA